MTLTRQPIYLKKYCLAAITGSFLHSRYMLLLAYRLILQEDQKNYRRQTMNIPIIVRWHEQLREYFSVEPSRSNDGESESISHSVVSDSLQSHGQRSLESYTPQGHKESDTTEATQRTGPYTLFIISVSLPHTHTHTSMMRTGRFACFVHSCFPRIQNIICPIVSAQCVIAIMIATSSILPTEASPSSSEQPKSC